jgi:4-alpha-glucanotransferase
MHDRAQGAPEPPVTDERGVDARYKDASGQERTVAEATIELLRQRIGRPPDEGRPSSLVTRPGRRVHVGRAQVVLEDGGELTVDGVLPDELPLGYHTLRPDTGPERRLVVSPGRCHLPSGWRAWGWAAQLYAARSCASWGIGDLADLGRLARWSADALGAGFVLVNPLHAVAPTLPQQASPYFPSSRRFRNPLYLSVEDVPGAADVGTDLDRLAAEGRALNEQRRIDRDAVWRLKLTALEAIWERTRPDAAFERWCQRQGAALDEFATWCVLAEHFGPSWRSWPSEFRDPDDPAVERFRREHHDRVRFHCWLQWLTDTQLVAAASGLAVIQDLPIGVDPDGADAWAWQHLLADGISIGSPPDEFNSQGQDWGLPPFVPWKLADAGYQPFVDTIRATIAAAGGLRVDHVMGLFRLWWVPVGAKPSDGAYVRYPSDDLLDIVALESHRAEALVVGEDLGTVEAGVRETMAERGMLSYRLLWFEPDDPAVWPELAMAAVTTHDLPTVAGLWDGSDLDEQRRIGLDPNEESTAAIRTRLVASGAIDGGDDPVAAILGAHRRLARAPSVLLSATLDDAVAERARPNIPGADGKRPNWSLALPVVLDELEGHPLPRQVAAILAEGVAPRTTAGPHDATPLPATNPETA